MWTFTKQSKILKWPWYPPNPNIKKELGWGVRNANVGLIYPMYVMPIFFYHPLLSSYFNWVITGTLILFLVILLRSDIAINYLQLSNSIQIYQTHWKEIRWHDLYIHIIFKEKLKTFSKLLLKWFFNMLRLANPWLSLEKWIQVILFKSFTNTIHHFLLLKKLILLGIYVRSF